MYAYIYFIFKVFIYIYIHTKGGGRCSPAQNTLNACMLGDVGGRNDQG